MHAQAAEDSVEGVRIVGKGLGGGEDLAGEVELLVEGEVGIAVEQGGGGVGGGELAHAGGAGTGVGGVFGGEGQLVGDVAGVCAEVEDVGEVAVDVLDGYIA